ncbi:MAG: type II secretion system protein GspM [Cytophagales bacterium]|nr:type II secretion system protein GspM [Cytophagales bacterium]
MNTSVGASISAWLAQRNPRERQLLYGAMACLLAALLWWVAIAPALQTYRESDAAHSKLDAQILAMQSMAAEAAALKALPAANKAQTQTWLDEATKRLAKGVLTMQGDHAQISFAGTAPETLAVWLAEARAVARLTPIEAHWKRDAGLLWSGIVVFELPK